MNCAVPYLLCTYCEEQYTDMADTTSMCSTCGACSYAIVATETDHMNQCIRNVKIGDSVVLKLLPYHLGYRVFEESVTLPVIGFNNKTVPIVGTMSKDLYENHHFITVSEFYGSPEMLKWKYCMGLDAGDIMIERIIKGPPPPRWRVGKSLGRTLYVDDRCIGMVDTAELAESIVAAMNR